MQYRFHLLGELTIRFADGTSSSPPFRLHGLLSALLLRPGPRPRHALVGCLFPDLPEEHGRRRFSDHLYLLRQALPDLPLELERDWVALPASSRWLDVEAFRAAARQASPDAWLEGLALYRADLLGGYCDDWLLEEREALHLEFVRLAHQACRWLSQQSDLDRLLSTAERLARQEPYDEAAVSWLMQAYRGLGRRGAALAAYERYVALAADELGIEPDPSLRQLAEDIRRSQPRFGYTAPLPSGLSPPDLVARGRAALDTGDWVTTAACLTELNSRPAGAGRVAVALLELDLAIETEEYRTAGRLIERLEAGRPAVAVRVARLANAQQQTARALAAAQQALAGALAAGDRVSQTQATAELALAHSRLGETSQALRLAEQAVTLARQGSSPADLAHSLYLLARILDSQRLEARARTAVGEALGLAEAYRLSKTWARALRASTWIHYNRGEYLQAADLCHQALAIWRDLGLGQGEASCLTELAELYDTLGDSRASLRLLDQAQALLTAQGDHLGVGIIHYHRAFTLTYLGDGHAPAAVEEAQEALEVMQAQGEQRWQASALFALGYALWLAKRPADSLDALRESARLHAAVDELFLLPEIALYQALALLSLGQTEAALSHAQQALLGLAQAELSPDVAIAIWYGYAAACEAAGEEAQAERYYRLAYDRAVTLAAQVSDETARQAFFEHDPVMRRLMRAAQARGLAPAPSSGIVTRWAADRLARPLQVQLTVDRGPVDQALRQARGAIALRRARLDRLRREAQAQGATLTVAQLADLLGVSQRTIQRDLATLHAS